MDWGDQQTVGIAAVKDWLANSEQQIFRLFGYAGTGKTTLAKYLAEGIEGQVLFAAFTGKAAYVLSQKGCEGASTIHSLIYHSSEKGKARLRELELQLLRLKDELAQDPELSPDAINKHPRIKDLEQLISQEKTNSARPFFTLNYDSPLKNAKLLVIDECSMVDKKMGEDLLSFGTKILVLGDPAQLPPVTGEGFFTSAKPDILLTEIHRQGKDNPIISMATDVRLGKSLPLGLRGESRVISSKEIDRQEMLEAGQIIVGRNKTRFAYNRRIRQLKGITEVYPRVGEKLICLRNHSELGLLNGSMWLVKEILALDEDSRRIFFRLEGEQGGIVDAEAHTHYFTGTELPYYERKDAQEFDFGYAITCHKSQGSQWNHVVVLDESECFKDKSRNWLYTAITRAAEKVTIIKG